MHNSKFHTRTTLQVLMGEVQLQKANMFVEPKWLYENSEISSDTALDKTKVSNSIVLEIHTYFDPINSTVQKGGEKKLMSQISHYDGSYKDRNVAIVYIAILVNI